MTIHASPYFAVSGAASFPLNREKAISGGSVRDLRSAGVQYIVCEELQREGPVVLDPSAVTSELRKRIATLEDSALYINDLANCIPEHCDWLWAIADKLTAEAAALKQSLDDQPSTGSSKAEGNERQ